MSENNPNANKTPNDNISDQLNELGKNLREALQTVWESEQRRKLQKEIEDGMSRLGDSLNQAAKDFSNSSTGQTIKEDVKDFQERWRSGEVRTKVHSDIIEALHKVNEELQKATKKNPPSTPDKPAG